MPAWLTAGWPSLAAVVVKAAVMYLTALVGLRLAHRRTLAQWTGIDFAAAVAVGAIVGRTAIAGTESLAVGVVALATILAAHAVATYARFKPWVTRLTDHRVRILVAGGRLRRRQLLLCGITESDLYSELRRHGVYSVSDLRYVLYEPKGDLTIVHRTSDLRGAEILDRGLYTAAQAPEAASGEELT